MATIFVLSSIVSVIGAALMVLRRNPIYSLMFLLVSFSGAAGIFYSLNATFVAVSQILVYAGAIAVLFLFVLMFIDLGKKGEETLPTRVDSLSIYEPSSIQITTGKEDSRFNLNYPAALVALSVFSIFIWVALGLPEEGFATFEAVPNNDPAGKAMYFGSTESIGRALLDSKGTYQGFALHYEVVGLVILVGVMGAVILGKRIDDEQREEAVLRKKQEAEQASH